MNLEQHLRSKNIEERATAAAKREVDEVMREKEYSEWMGKQGFDAFLHAICCKIAFNGGWESRQTEVDELQKRLDEALWLLKVYRDEMDHGFEVSKATVKKLEQALKGGSNDH